MNLEQIALQCAKEVWTDLPADWFGEDRKGKVKTNVVEFARRLVAALGAQEPVAWYDWESDGSIFMTADRMGTPLFAAPPICPTVPDGWQPIETAPKDGTHVLLYFPELKKRGNEEVVIGFWHQPGNPSHPGFWMGWGSGRKTATHWMPLPAAPEYKP